MKRNFKFSWSALGDFDNCPRKYFLARIAKIKVEAAPQLLDGIKFHDFCEIVNTSIIENKEEVLENGEEFLKKFLDKAETNEERNFILFEIDRYNNLKKDNNEKYYIPILCESWLEGEIDGIPFRGKQDLLCRDINNNFFILDYKTRLPFRDKDLKKLEHQMILYSELASKQFNMDITHICGYFYKEKNSNHSKKTFYKKIHPATKRALHRYIKKTVNGILNENKFLPKISVLCNSCSYKDICWGIDEKSEEIHQKNVEILKDYNENKQKYYPGYDLADD